MKIIASSREISARVQIERVEFIGIEKLFKYAYLKHSSKESEEPEEHRKSVSETEMKDT